MERNASTSVDFPFLLSEELTYAPAQTGYPLYVTAQRVRPAAASSVSVSPEDPEGLTLVVLHSTSFHKETWFPALDDLFARLAQSPPPPPPLSSQSRASPAAPKIAEAYLIECPNHGRSAVLNERLLAAHDFPGDNACARYADAAAHFLLATPSIVGSSPNSGNHSPRRRPRQLVAIGHSLGGVAAALVASHPALAPLFRAAVLVEPMLSPPPLGNAALFPLRKALLRSAYERVDVWRSRTKAYAYFSPPPHPTQDGGAKKGGKTTTRWDDRVARCFVRYAVRDHPARERGEYDGVTLCCAREQEAAMYRDCRGPVEPVPALARLARRIPVHLVLGEVKDCVPGNVHDALVRECAWRGVDVMPGVGHLAVQTAPGAVAGAVWEALGACVREGAFVVEPGVRGDREEGEREREAARAWGYERDMGGLQYHVVAAAMSKL
ncbi:hypothetical protein PUNSTDRAFT_126533 [Punctularia strigosozonata HHB-11173 SS5]|uniref:uncharacterized protein n=1 Tax=Punctularia strigosozonata (strain HHB-11173) TaxID=741275 RepID=UPI0004417EB9|nr:uncharacterized protein PUNSTDRAFT_126533 [Punctularia strigosozonata HHB-11173 SS5]EIN08541.1 hypothetical protein PUNSTDRAFT_126533 [Punctularia strigosozonata HHB-11173 SS5]